MNIEKFSTIEEFDALPTGTTFWPSWHSPEERRQRGLVPDEPSYFIRKIGYRQVELSDEPGSIEHITEDFFDYVLCRFIRKLGP